MAVKKVILASPRGFCAGVDRAIVIVEDCLRIFGKPVYVKHQIVHNRHVVAALEQQGAVTVEKIEEIPDGAVTVFSAHGSPPGDYAVAKQKGLRLIDATCPLVTKVHLEVHRYHKLGYKIVYIGHRGHVEALGVTGELPGDIFFVETLADIEHLPEARDQKMICLTQTTLSVDDTQALVTALKEKFPLLEFPPGEDICYATTNRQEAVKALAGKCDLILVVGSKNSSNSNRLRETAIASGCKAYLIDDVSDLQAEWIYNIHSIGITAGASAPEYLIQELINFFVQKGAQVEELSVTREHMTFPEPRTLTEAKKAYSSQPGADSGH